MISFFLNSSRRKPSFFLIYFILLFFLKLPIYSQIRKSPVHQEIINKLKFYSTNNCPEKVYVHTDKDFYINGETIWFKVYLVDGITHLSSSKSKVIYVELLDSNNNVVTKQILYAEKSSVSSEIKISEKTTQGEYKLRAYTKYMLNKSSPIAYEKSILIWNQAVSKIKMKAGKPTREKNKKQIPSINQLSPQFFPEGGHMIAGMPNILGFEIKDINGNFISTKGEIIDEKGNPAAFFESHEFGLGILNLEPELGKKYYAAIKYKDKKEVFPLPIALDRGYMLNVKNNKEYLDVIISTNIGKGLQGAYLLGHMRGDVFFEHTIERSKVNNLVFKIKTKDLLDGIAHFTLFNAAGEPLCERLVFIDNSDNDTSLSINTSNDNIDFRSPLGVKLNITDKNNLPLKGELSLSVFTDTNKFQGKNSNSNIKSWLLINSDLGNTVSDPNYFFENDSGYRKRLLDALMLTHGWRRFVWKELLDNSVSKTPEFKPEKGIVFYGKTTAFKNKYKPLPAQVKISVLEEDFYQDIKVTNAQGKFNFGPFFFQDTVSIVAEAISKDIEKEMETSIHMYPTFWNSPISKEKRFDSKVFKSNKAIKYINQSNKKKATDFEYDSKITRLKEVTVVGKEKTTQKIIDDEIKRMKIYSWPTNRIILDSVLGLEDQSALDVLRLVLELWLLEPILLRRFV